MPSLEAVNGKSRQVYVLNPFGIGPTLESIDVWSNALCEVSKL